ncbi:hypothetical protein GCM10009725_30090 [Aeromicrobium tamlense]
MSSAAGTTRIELLGCTNCDFEERAAETPLFEYLRCQNCDEGSLETRYAFPDIDEDDICSCGRAPIHEEEGQYCAECWAGIYGLHNE